MDNYIRYIFEDQDDIDFQNKSTKFTIKEHTGEILYFYLPTFIANRFTTLCKQPFSFNINLTKYESLQAFKIFIQDYFYNINTLELKINEILSLQKYIISLRFLDYYKIKPIQNCYDLIAFVGYIESNIDDEYKYQLYSTLLKYTSADMLYKLKSQYESIPNELLNNRLFFTNNHLTYDIKILSYFKIVFFNIHYRTCEYDCRKIYWCNNESLYKISNAFVLAISDSDIKNYDSKCLNIKYYCNDPYYLIDDLANYIDKKMSANINYSNINPIFTKLNRILTYENLKIFGYFNYILEKQEDINFKNNSENTKIEIIDINNNVKTLLFPNDVLKVLDNEYFSIMKSNKFKTSEFQILLCGNESHEDFLGFIDDLLDKYFCKYLISEIKECPSVDICLNKNINIQKYIIADRFNHSNLYNLRPFNHYWHNYIDQYIDIFILLIDNLILDTTISDYIFDHFYKSLDKDKLYNLKIQFPDYISDDILKKYNCLINTGTKYLIEHLIKFNGISYFSNYHNVSSFKITEDDNQWIIEIIKSYYSINEIKTCYFDKTYKQLSISWTKGVEMFI